MLNLELGFMRYDKNKNYQELIGYALSNGVISFETCYFYLNYQCEQIVNNLLKPYSRDRYEICGKFSFTEASRFSRFQDFYYDQLRRVNGNYFDTYLLHCLRPAAIPYLREEVLDFFQKEKEKGNIRRFGFSEQCDDIMLNKILELQYPWDIAQMPLNYFDWYINYTEKNYKLLQERHIPIIAQSPLKGGLLANDYNNALAFVVDKQPQTILVGTTSIEHLKSIQQSLESPAELNYAKIYDIINIYKEEHFIMCSKCGQCIQACPQQIPLPFCYELYNQHLIGDNKAGLTNFAYFFDAPSDRCIKCHKCASVCPIQNDGSLLLPHLQHLYP